MINAQIVFDIIIYLCVGFIYLSSDQGFKNLEIKDQKILANKAAFNFMFRGLVLINLIFFPIIIAENLFKYLTIDTHKEITQSNDDYISFH